MSTFHFSSDPAPPAPDPAVEQAVSPGHGRDFSLFDSAAHVRSMCGIPFFEPPIPVAHFFNIWAYVLGPLYYFFYRLWRKALTLVFIFLVSVFFFELFVSLAGLGEHSAALREILHETYVGPGFCLAVLSFVFPVFIALGRDFVAFLTASAFAAVFWWGEFRCPYLSFDDISGFVWFGAPYAWRALAGAGLFCLLARRIVMFLGLAALMLLLWYAGLPLSISIWPWLLEIFFHLLCGMTATWDVYRHRIRGERFWW